MQSQRRTQPPLPESVLGLHRDRDSRAVTWVKRTPERALVRPTATGADARTTDAASRTGEGR